MSAPALSPSQLSPEVRGRRRPLGQPFRFASPPLPPLLDSASAPPALDDMSFLSLDDSQSFLTECGERQLASSPTRTICGPRRRMPTIPSRRKRWPSGPICGGLIAAK